MGPKLPKSNIVQDVMHVVLCYPQGPVDHSCHNFFFSPIHKKKRFVITQTSQESEDMATWVNRDDAFIGKTQPKFWLSYTSSLETEILSDKTLEVNQD